MINNETRKIRPFYYLVLTGFIIIVFLDYSYRVGIWHYKYTYFVIPNVHHFILNNYLDLTRHPYYKLITAIIRALMLVYMYMFWISEVNYIKNKDDWHKKKMYYKIILVFGFLLFLTGFLPQKDNPLNYLLVPAGFFLSNLSINFLTKKKQDLTADDDPLKHLPEGEEEMLTLYLDTEDKGTLKIFEPQMGIGIVGAPGYGKSFFVLLKIHHQWFKKGYPAFIYDFKGNPPTLGYDAWQMAYHLNSKKRPMPKFHIFNPSDPLGSVRINPLDPVNITNKFQSRNLAETMLKNLDRESIDKSDFWNKNALSVIDNSIFTLANFKKEFSTLGHWIAFVLRPVDQVCKVLMKLNPMIRKDMMAVISAYEKDASSQLAGVEATTGLPIATLNIPEIFYLCSESEISLDISNPDDPSIFVACSDPNLRYALQPVLGLITSLVKNNINQQGKLPCLFSVDELSTQYILDLADLPATGRSNGVVTCVAFQTLKQLEEMYKKVPSQVIWQNMTNQFILRIGDEEQAKLLSATAGEYEKIKKGASTNLSEGHITMQENIQKEKVIPVSKIMQQPKGHAYGTIAGVENPMFGCKLKAQTLQELLGIEESDFVDLPRYYHQDVTREALQQKMHDVWMQIHNEVDDFVNSIITEEDIKIGNKTDEQIKL